jgi:hypothetical protein
MPRGWSKPSSFATVLLSLAPSLQAAEPPPNYVAAFAGTTLAYHPPGGGWDGPQSDLALTAGVGRFVSRSVALELDFGPTLLNERYASFSLVPGLTWNVSAHVYLAARFPVAIDPDLAVYSAPGVGLAHTFANGLTPTLEVNAVTRLGHGKPDLGIAVTLGLLYSF